MKKVYGFLFFVLLGISFFYMANQDLFDLDPVVTIPWKKVEVGGIFDKKGREIKEIADDQISKAIIANDYLFFKKESDEGINFKKKYAYGFNLLHIAAQFNRVKMADLLIENGLDIEAKTDQGFSPLAVATDFEAVEMVKFLVGEGADIHTRYGEGWSLIHAVVNTGNAELLGYYLKSGLDINLVSVSGMSALHLCVFLDDYDMAKLLIKKGLIPKLKTRMV